jgi:hypothetical protein
MKNSLISRKYLIIILIAVVVIIYGNLFFKVNKTLTKTQTTEDEISVADSTKLESDFSLTFSGKYKDPFKQNYQPPKKIEKEEKKQVKKDTPKISLQGIVGKTAMLNYNNELYFVQKGDSLMDYRIVRIYPDSLQLKSSEEQINLKVLE